MSHEEVSKERVLIAQALDLAIQAWRTVPSARDRITEAIAALGRLDERAEAAEERLEQAEAALGAIRDLPSEHDLMLNAVARAMYEIANRGLAIPREEPPSE